MVRKTQGAEANASGKFLEDIVRLQANEQGYRVLKWKDRPLPGPDGYLTHLLIESVPYTNIYGGSSRSEFMAIAPRDGKDDIALIECRWQSVGGSVDEKWPYMLLNAENTDAANTVVILYGGGGARKASIDWAIKRASLCLHKKILVINQDEFRIWFRKFSE